MATLRHDFARVAKRGLQQREQQRQQQQQREQREQQNQQGQTSVMSAKQSSMKRASEIIAQRRALEARSADRRIMF